MLCVESHKGEVKVSASAISSKIWGCVPSPLVAGRINVLVSWTEVLSLLVVGRKQILCLCQVVLPQAFSYFRSHDSVEIPFKASSN